MEVSTIVIDTGAYSTCAGFGGDSEPQCIIPTVIGRQKTVPGQPPLSKDIYAGSEVFAAQSQLHLKCPITDRIISNTDEIEKFWNYIFQKELNIKPEEHPVLMTESPQNTKQMREKTTQIMMETFKVPAFYLSYPEVLSLYASNTTSGLVIDAGETITHVLPVYKCFGMTHVVGRLDIGGRTLNAYLKKLLNDSGIVLPSANEKEIIRDIKEQKCYVSLQKAEKEAMESGLDSTAKFDLPDGNTITLTKERFYCPELFFNPQLAALQNQEDNNKADSDKASILSSSPGLVQTIADTVMKVDEDLRDLMFDNIYLSGGSSMFPGLDERIEKELSRLVQRKVTVKAPSNRKNSAWIGGSYLVSLATFAQMWITKTEYDEVGPEIVNIKCF